MVSAGGPDVHHGCVAPAALSFSPFNGLSRASWGALRQWGAGPAFQSWVLVGLALTLPPHGLGWPLGWRGVIQGHPCRQFPPFTSSLWPRVAELGALCCGSWGAAEATWGSGGMRLGAVGGDGGVRALAVSGVPGDPGRDGGRVLSPPSPPRVLLLRAPLTAPHPPREPALQPRGGVSHSLSPSAFCHPRESSGRGALIPPSAVPGPLPSPHRFGSVTSTGAALGLPWIPGTLASVGPSSMKTYYNYTL